MNITDQRIWDRGIVQQGQGTPHERHFLRGLHDKHSLADLANLILTHSHVKAVKLTSSWIDKHPQAHPNAGSWNCELGDLLIVARIGLQGGGSLNRSVGWILQGKVGVSAPSVSQAGATTKREIDLYERYPNWAFTLKHGNRTLGNYDISRDSDIAPATHPLPACRHWSFMLFCRDQQALRGSWSASSPVQWVWPVTSNVAIGSFSGGVIGMLQKTPSSKGVVLDSSRNPEWTRLCNDLLSFTRNRDSRLARGKWQHDHVAFALAFSGEGAEVNGAEHSHLLLQLNAMGEPPIGARTPTDGDDEDHVGIDTIEIDVILSREAHEQ